MNPYDNAVIRVRKIKGQGDTIFAELRDSDGNLLISATLEYVVNELQLRMTPAGDK